jgi:sarcosine oxidase subunit beta
MAFDFVIVGGGVFGCGTAWELAKQGASVVVLESDRVASGASGGPGMRGVRANGRDEAELPLARLAIELWPELDQALDGRTGYRRTGGLELFENEASLERAERQVARENQHGIESRLIERDQLRGIERALGPSIRGAVFCPYDGIADHTATTLALADAARGAGAEIREGSRVERLEDNAVVLEGGQRVGATRAVVVLANAGTSALLATLGLEIELPVVYPQIIVASPVDRFSLRYLIGHMERRLAAKQLPNGEFMISGGWLGRWNKEEGRAKPLAENIAGNMNDARAVFPALAGVESIRAYADRGESVGPSLLPIIDRVPGFESIVAGAGWTGHGFALAPAVNRLLAEWLLGGERPSEFEGLGWRVSEPG